MDPSAANLENHKIVLYYEEVICRVIIVIALILVTQLQVLFYIELKYLIADNLKHEMHEVDI